MSAISLPVTRPSGRALLVGNPASRHDALALLSELGFACDEADDPYGGFAELCQQPLAFHAVILSLPSFYREELQMIPVIRQRFPHIEIWLAQSEGRQSIMAEALCLGADGLLSEEGLLRIGMPNHSAGPRMAEASGQDDRASESSARPINGQSHSAADSEADLRGSEEEMSMGEPVLTADELRALLQDAPFAPRGAK